MRRDDDSVFASLQTVAGVRYNRAEYNRDIIDTYILRKARQKGVRLPTGGPPEEYKYLGAYVFPSTAGTSRNVVYIDLSSLYPSLLLSLNASPETVIGTSEDLADSPYTEDDCVWGYIDPRPVKHLGSEDGSWRQYTDGTYKMVYDPETPSMKWTCDEADGPRHEKLYFPDHETQKGFLTECVEELIDLKNQYRGTSLYGSTKRVTNSIYGVLGFATEDSSFRLFDWRIAEAITLCGRMMIQYSSDYVLDRLHERGYTDAYTALGDSVPANEPVVIRDENGAVDIVPIERLQGRAGDVEVWSDDGFTTVKDVIKKPNRKTMYQTRTLDGVVNVTEDHSLLRSDGTEVSPEDLSNGDELLHRDTSDALPETETRTVASGIPWVLGLFVAEGTCNEYRRKDSGLLRYPWSIVNQDKELLEHAAQILAEQWNISTTINDTRKSSSCWKLQLRDNGHGEGKWIAMDFRSLCYDGDAKCVPTAILNGTQQERREFLHGFHAGDGHIQDIDGRDRDFDEFTTASKPLATGVAMLLKSFGWDTTIDTRDNYSNCYYRVRAVEGSKYHNHNRQAVRDNDVREYDGDYVYDLETENHHFHAGVGDIVVHNTDGCAIALPSASTRHEALSGIEEIVEDLNSTGYDAFFADRMGVPPEHHHGEIEVESYAPSVFVPADDDHKDYPYTDVGVKKRRIEWQTWDENDGECDSISITGLEAERSDVAPITQQAQRVFAETLRMDDGEAREQLFPQLRQWANAIEQGDTSVVSLDDVCKRGGIGQDLLEYGTASRRASTFYRGCKYANQYIEGVTIQRGDKPRLVYVSDVRGDYSSVYDSDTAEDGDPVDAVTVPDPDQLPDAFQIDWQRHYQKALKEPMDPLLETRFGVDAWSEIRHQHEQTGLGSFEAQSGD